VLVYVAQRHYFDGRHLDQSQQVNLAVPAAADQPYAPLLFFRVGAGGEGGAQSASQKIASVHHISVWRVKRGYPLAVPTYRQKPINKGFDCALAAFPPFYRPSSRNNRKKYRKRPIFRCFLLYKRKALPYDRIDWKGSKHFRIVLFYEIPRYGTGDMRSPLRKSNQDHRRLRWLKSND